MNCVYYDTQEQEIPPRIVALLRQENMGPILWAGYNGGIYALSITLRIKRINQYVEITGDSKKRDAK